MEPLEGRSLWDELLELYTEDEARIWLSSPQPLLGGRYACEMMAKGEFEPLFRLIDGMNHGVYV